MIYGYIEKQLTSKAVLEAAFEIVREEEQVFTIEETDEQKATHLQQLGGLVFISGSTLREYLTEKYPPLEGE